ncbi:MAG: cupin domain-containing protein [Actinomycetota bacterium]|nr:cupin domain-containing protein [Actinomycetota bacterium]MDQ6944980.1 cupin domain-containing protein [Actinomycetota bacterium]
MAPVRRFDATQGPRIVRPRHGKTVDLGSCGARFLAWGEETGGGFALVEYPIPARHLAAPLHRHSLEDEYSFVLEGRLGALLGDDVVYAEVGDLVFKPRHQWHTFWNADDTRCRILEIVSPAGFEHYFEELSDGLRAAGEYQQRYQTEVDLDGTQHVLQRFGLLFPSVPRSPTP